MIKWVSVVLVLSMALCMVACPATADSLLVEVNESEGLGGDSGPSSAEIALDESGRARYPSPSPKPTPSPTPQATPDAVENYTQPTATPTIQPTKKPPQRAPEYTPAPDPTKEPTQGSVVAVMDDASDAGFYAGELGDRLVDSPYFASVDFYSAASNDHLTILPKFQTAQQSEPWSSGPAAALMVLQYFGKRSTYTEQALAAFRGEQLTGKTAGDAAGTTSLRQMIDIFEGVGGFETLSAFDMPNAKETFTLGYIRQVLKEQLPIIVGWNELGGHWQVIIGYDTMGTENLDDDVVIMADPRDSGDHNQDGYFVYSAERFLKNFTFYDLFVQEDGRERCFLIVRPISD